MHEQIEQIIHENFHDDEFDVAALAAKIPLSRTQVFRRVKKFWGLSPSELIAKIRLDEAERLARRPDPPTARRAAEMCGFQDASFFSRAFKRRFGKTYAKVKSEVEFARNPE